ncbi:TPA: hypothetical protein PW471_003262 [Enterococcus faecium]|nr:hypothetical protein [Enterococcus faecium]HDL2904336.1 hypothetical protein [Enterococcus faecium]
MPFVMIRIGMIVAFFHLIECLLCNKTTICGWYDCYYGKRICTFPVASL